MGETISTSVPPSGCCRVILIEQVIFSLIIGEPVGVVQQAHRRRNVKEGALLRRNPAAAGLLVVSGLGLVGESGAPMPPPGPGKAGIPWCQFCNCTLDLDGHNIKFAGNGATSITGVLGRCCWSLSGGRDQEC